jgi:hypothetical protein
MDLLVGAGEALANDLTLEGAALVEGDVLVVLREPRLPLLVHEQHEPDRHLALSFPCCGILEVSSTCGSGAQSPSSLSRPNGRKNRRPVFVFLFKNKFSKCLGFFFQRTGRIKRPLCPFKLCLKNSAKYTLSV